MLLGQERCPRGLCSDVSGRPPRTPRARAWVKQLPQSSIARPGAAVTCVHDSPVPICPPPCRSQNHIGGGGQGEGSNSGEREKPPPSLRPAGCLRRTYAGEKPNCNLDPGPEFVCLNYHSRHDRAVLKQNRSRGCKGKDFSE